MDSEYEISVTVGVRQRGNAAGSFQASDTFMIGLNRFDDLFYVFGEIRNLAETLTVRSTGSQDKKR